MEYRCFILVLVIIIIQSCSKEKPITTFDNHNCEIEVYSKEDKIKSIVIHKNESKKKINIKDTGLNLCKELDNIPIKDSTNKIIYIIINVETKHSLKTGVLFLTDEIMNVDTLLHIYQQKY